MYILTSQQYPRNPEVKATAVNWSRALCCTHVNVPPKDIKFFSVLFAEGIIHTTPKSTTFPVCFHFTNKFS